MKITLAVSSGTAKGCQIRPVDTFDPFLAKGAIRGAIPFDGKGIVKIQYSITPWHAQIRSSDRNTRPSRHFRQLMKPRQTSDLRQPRQQTTFGLTPRSGHSRPWRHFRQPMKPRQTSGLHHPRQLTTSGSRPASITPGHHDSSGNRWCPDASQASAILTDGRPSGSPPAPITSGHRDISGN